ncbi:MAG: FtsX-like permease family protein [Bacteroidota bacterium]
MKILKVIFKNALRHKLRALLTILGISIAVVAFGVLRTVVTAWNSGVEGAAANRLVTRQAISFIFPLPYTYREQMAKIDGVENVTWANWFGGVYIDKNNFFSRMAIDPETYFDVYPEIKLPKDELAIFKREQNSCVIGSSIAEQYHLKIGDVMNLEGDIYPGNWEFVVRGIYTGRDKNTDLTQMLFHWNYINERMRQVMPGRAGDVGWYVIKIKDPNRSAEISEKVDGLFKNSRAETKTETERAFQQGFVAASGAIISAMNFMSFVIIGIIMLVLGNTMIMSARERTKEYAVLKTLGFSGGHLVAFIGGESMLIAVLGGTIGLLLTFPLVESISLFIPKGFFPVFFIENWTIVLAGVSALLVGVVASIFPIVKAVRTSIVDGLQHIG